MKIFCEYCGAQFESDSANLCPACGAAFNDNDQMEHRIRHEQRLDELEIQDQQMDLRERQAQIDNMHAQNKRMDRERKMVHVGCMIPVVIIGLFFLTAVVVAFVDVIQDRIIEDMDDEPRSTLEVITQPEEEDVPVSAGFNEAAETVNYSVICDSFEEVDRYPFEPAEGYMYVSFHIVVKNTGIGKVNTTNDIICLADGMLATYTWHSDRKEMPDTTLPAGVSAEGYMCFEVPVDTKEFELRYGDLVTIYIENTITEGNE